MLRDSRQAYLLSLSVLYERVIYHKDKKMFEIIRGEAPDYLKTSFTFSSDVYTIFHFLLGRIYQTVTAILYITSIRP